MKTEANVGNGVQSDGKPETPSCPLGPAHGFASSFANADGVRCCDWCGYPVDLDIPTRLTPRAGA